MWSGGTLESGYGFSRSAVRFAERPHAHAQEPDAPLERHALQALARGAADGGRVARRRIERAIPGERLEVVVAQLQSYRPPGVAFSLEVGREPRAQLGEDVRERVAVAHRVQVVFEGRFAADRFRLAVGEDRPVVETVRGLVHPGAMLFAEALAQEHAVGLRELADRADAERFEPRTRLGADAGDLARRQRPDARGDVRFAQHGEAAGLLEIGGDLREQLVRRDSDRAREPGRLAHRALDRS